MSSDRKALPYRLDLSRQELTRDGSPVAVAPKVLRLLQVLVERGGRVVNHQTLLREVWSGVRVSGDAVRFSIRELRKALGDSPRPAHFVETVPRQGWRFVGQAIASGPEAWLLLPRGTEGTTPVRDAAAPVRVGRQAELLALRGALSSAQAGRRQLRVVSGEAGIGKTTLVEAFLEPLRGHDDVLVGRGRSIEHVGPSEAYAPLLEALEDLAVRVGPVAVDTLRRYAPMWLDSLPALTDPAERAAIQQEVQGATQARRVREVSGALAALAATRTVILWLDDLHWSDVSTLECVADLMQRRDPARLLLVAAERPAEAGPALRDVLRDLTARSETEVIALGTLTPTDAQAYAGERFGLGEAGATALGGFLHQTTEGVPLFLVSVADGLVAGGQLSDASGSWKIEGPLASVDVPANVKLLLERELDRASPDERAVLEVASLVGMEFSAAAVAAGCALGTEAVEAVCQGLAGRRSFLAAADSGTWPDGTIASSYAFVHALHREVLAARVPSARRARIHGALGRRLESAFAGCESEVATALAYHFEEAGEAERAVRHRTLAGERAARCFANREAADHLRHALRLLETLPPCPERDALEMPIRLSLNVPLAAIGGYASPELEANLERFLELTGDFQDTPAAFSILLGLWSLTIARADLATAASLAERLLAIADHEGDPVSRLQAHRALGHTRFYEGGLTASLQHLDRALDGYDAEQHQRQDHTVGDDPLVLAYSYGIWTHWFRGEAERAIACSARALAVGARLDHPPSLAFARFYTAVLHHLRRDTQRALAAAEASLELATREGMAFWAALSGLLRGYALLERGATARALPLIEQSYVAWDATGAEVGRPYFLTLVADAHRRVDRLDDAFALLPTIDASLERTGQAVFLPERHRLEGVLLAARGDAAAAVAPLVRAIEVAREQSGLGLGLRAAVSLAELERDAGVAAGAGERLLEIVSAIPEGREEPDMCRARALLAGPRRG